MNNVTAEEILADLQYQWEETGEYKMYFAIDIPGKLREFAKIKVKEALVAAHRNMQLPEEDLEFTLDCYPETNII